MGDNYAWFDEHSTRAYLEEATLVIVDRDPAGWYTALADDYSTDGSKPWRVNSRYPVDRRFAFNFRETNVEIDDYLVKVNSEVTP